ncbi:MAG: DUF3822 family protein [Chitinophagaceae bacterium]|nr:DUF3822 family protein [Chitinophagaceae bacterium]
MVHPAFDIKRDDIDNLPEDCRLLVELSEQSFNYILFTRSPDQLFILRQYTLYTSGDKNTRDILEEIISGDTVLQQFGSTAIIVYNFPDANLVPAEFFNVDIKSPFAKLVHGETAADTVFDEHVSDWNIHNIYAVSRDLHNLCKDKFGGGQYWHLYTMILRWSRQSEVNEGSHARVIFYNDKFVAALFTNGALQLLQTFSYQTPEDAAYYLLLICRQFGIAPAQLTLYLSGLIDEQSTLYSELIKYFEQVHYEGIPPSYGTNGILQQYPSHYFSPLLKMSLCV